MTMTMEQIERLCRAYDEARGVLSTRVSDLEAELDAAKRRALPAIKRAVAKAAEAEAALHAAVAATPALFVKPKTQIFHGVKVGYQKGKGKLEWEDDDALVARIERTYKGQDDVLDLLLIVTKKPSKQGLNTLDAKDLRALGVTVEDTDDRVVVKPVDGAVEKLVKALLKDAVEDATEAA